MNWIKKITPRVALLLALPLIVIACTVSYKFNGSSINYDNSIHDLLLFVV